MTQSDVFVRFTTGYGTSHYFSRGSALPKAFLEMPIFPGQKKRTSTTHEYHEMHVLAQSAANNPNTDETVLSCSSFFRQHNKNYNMERVAPRILFTSWSKSCADEWGKQSFQRKPSSFRASCGDSKQVANGRPQLSGGRNNRRREFQLNNQTYFPY